MIFKALFPYPGPEAVHDQRIRDLFTYARKAEKDFFEAAPDKEAYLHMLAEKINKIQKELEERKKWRMNEQQQQANRAPPTVVGEEIPPPEPPSQARDWHASVTPDLRSQEIGKFVKVNNYT